MAIQREAALTQALRLDEQTVLLEFEILDGARLGFRGGQYLIVDPGVAMADGRVAKRAYSIVSSDREQRKFSLAVRRIANGPGSGYMHALTVQDRIRFSGPWGKGAPEGDVAIASDQECWIIVSDTGITGALGLLNGAALASSLGRCRLLWLTAGKDDFLPESCVRELLPATLGDFTLATIAPPGHPERPADTLAAVTRWQDGRELGKSVIATLNLEDTSRGCPPASSLITNDADKLNAGDTRRGCLLSRAYLAGDGAVIDIVKKLLLSRGLASAAIQSEYFFNRPSRPTE